MQMRLQQEKEEQEQRMATMKQEQERLLYEKSQALLEEQRKTEELRMNKQCKNTLRAHQATRQERRPSHQTRETSGTPVPETLGAASNPLT